MVTIALALRAVLSFESAGITLAIDVAVLALVWRLRGMLRRRTLPTKLLEPTVFGISLLLLFSCLIRLHLTSDTSEAVLVAALLAAAPLVFNAPKWFFGFAATAACGWLAAAWQAQPSETLMLSGLGLLVGIALGSFCVVRRSRRRLREATEQS